MPDFPFVKDWCSTAVDALANGDPELHKLAARELTLQRSALNLVASQSPTLPAVHAAQGMPFGSVTAEGYPGKRFHPGTQAVDQVEVLAQSRALALFGARHANVQPLSGTAANLSLLTAILAPGDAVLSLGLGEGGHLSHVSPVSSLSRHFDAHYYQLGDGDRIDFDIVASAASKTRPRIIVCGASAYPRAIDFASFAEIASDVGAVLLADISHISGIIAAGLHPSPFKYADIVTTSTYKQLCGPHGGLCFLGRPNSELSAASVDRAVFPSFQGTPDFGSIAGKAVALKYAISDDFRERMARVISYAKVFESVFRANGIPMVTDGTDNHMLLIDLRHLRSNLSGAEVSERFESAGVLVNKNVVPRERRPPSLASGIRIGTNTLAFLTADESQVTDLASCVAMGLKALATEDFADFNIIAGDLSGLASDITKNPPAFGASNSLTSAERP